MSPPIEDTGSFPLVHNKLHRARVTGDLVPRPRSLERLDRRRAPPPTLVSALAGSGKSTLISSWLKACDCPSA